MFDAPCCDGSRCQDCPGDYVCNCLKVTEEMVLDAVAGGARSIRDLRRIIGAGDGCTACHARLNTYIQFAVERDLRPLVMA